MPCGAVRRRRAHEAATRLKGSIVRRPAGRTSKGAEAALLIAADDPRV